MVKQMNFFLFCWRTVPILLVSTIHSGEAGEWRTSPSFFDFVAVGDGVEGDNSPIATASECGTVISLRVGGGAG